MRSNTVIQIKHSTVTDRPPSLNIGELAYSYTANTLFIGTSANSVINIGGFNIANVVDYRTSDNTFNTLVFRDANGMFSATRVYASLYGNANTATKFQTPRYINIYGDVVKDSVNTSNVFDGTANADLILKLNDTGIVAGTYGGVRNIPVIKYYANGVAYFAGNTHIETTLGFTGDYGSANVEIYNQTLNFAGGDGITTHVHDSNNEVTIEVDETVVKTDRSDQTISGNIIVTGNLEVQGNTLYTRTENVLIEDNIITLNASIGQASAPTRDAGIEIDRGTEPNSAIIWNETINRWTYTNDGTLYANIGSVQNAFVTFTANGTSVTPQSNNDTLIINGLGGILITANDSSNTINVSLTELAQGNSGSQIFVAPNGNDEYDGLALSRPKRTIRAAVNASRPGMKIQVAAGTYDEITPIIVPQRVEMQGDGERTSIIRPVDPTKDIFWLNNNCLIHKFAFENYTGSACAFPALTIESGTAQTGTTNTITLSASSDSLPNYYTEMQVTIVDGAGAGQTKTITSYDSTTKLATVDSDWSPVVDYTSVYEIKIQRRTTPAANTARYSTFITASPYVYVCSSRTTTGTGLKVDGARTTGNKSMVSAQFTQINTGGIGFHVLNDGYAQLVSMYAIFCDIGFLAETGGTASMGNCNVNFGNKGLRANGRGALIMTGNINVEGQIGDFTLNLNNITVNTNPYMSITANVPYVGLVGYVDGDTSDTYYYVVSSTLPSAGNTIVNLKNSLDNVFTTGTTIRFYQQSQLRASGQTFEFVGAGTTLTTALPRNGGVPNNESQIERANGGAVFCTSTNEAGDFQVSDLIIEQSTGTISGRTFSRSLFAQLTPFVLALES
jgi:hypothetical protein